MPATSLSRNRDTPPVDLKVAIDLGEADLLAEAVNPAHSIATRMACSWKSGTPRVFPSTFSSSGLWILHRLLAFPPTQIGMHHVALDGSRPNDRHFDDEVIEGPGAQARQHRHLRP